MQKTLISDCRVIRSGRISKFGTVYILLDTVPEPEGDEEFGLECWSEKLYNFRDGNFKAKIENDHVVIFDQAGEKISDITVADVFSIRSKYRSTVMQNGWLISDRFTKKYSECKTKLYLDALLNLEKGQNPNIFDDRLFTKVSPKFTGSKVICLFHKGLPVRKSLVKVFTEDGLMLDSETSWPLSAKK